MKKALLEFCLVYTACILTPIHIMIDQKYELISFLPITLLVCDISFFCKFINNLWNSKKNSKSEVFMAMFGFPSVVVLPLCYSYPTVSRFILWLSASRMLKLVTLSKKFSHMQSSLFQLNETATKAIQVVLYTVLYASTLSCVWFYISCTDRTTCKDSHHLAEFSESRNNPHFTWILADDVIIPSSVLSCYVRAMHYVVQTLLTVGYGDIHPVNSYEMVVSLYILVNGE